MVGDLADRLGGFEDESLVHALIQHEEDCGVEDRLGARGDFSPHIGGVEVGAVGFEIRKDRPPFRKKKSSPIDPEPTTG